MNLKVKELKRLLQAKKVEEFNEWSAETKSAYYNFVGSLDDQLEQEWKDKLDPVFIIGHARNPLF